MTFIPKSAPKFKIKFLSIRIICKMVKNNSVLKHDSAPEVINVDDTQFQTSLF